MTKLTTGPMKRKPFEKVMDYIKAVRTMRTEMNVHPAKKTSMIIETADAAPFQKAQVYLAKFAFATDVTFTEKYEGSTDGMVQVSTHAARGFIPMMELIDRDKELARLTERPRPKRNGHVREPAEQPQVRGTRPGGTGGGYPQ